MSCIPDAKNFRASVGAFYRLLTPGLLPLDIEKVIYLDSDIIVNLDIKELWQVDLGDKILAAVPEILSWKTIESMKIWFPLCDDGLIKYEDYFNSGVIVMNMKLLRDSEFRIMDGLRFRAKNSRYMGYGDQNVLNYCFSTQTLKLPIKFNRFAQVVRLEKEPLAKKIYHYAGGSLGLGIGLDMKDPLNRLWMNYFFKTPWFDADTISNLYEEFDKAFQDIQVENKKSMMNLAAAMSGKTRAFIILEDDLDKLVKTFFVKSYEEIIIVKPPMPSEKLINRIRTSRDKQFFFILLPDFPLNLLTEAGLVQGKDFMNGYEFFSRTLVNSFRLIQKM